jgi:hypothetical protein
MSEFNEKRTKLCSIWLKVLSDEISTTEAAEFSSYSERHIQNLKNDPSKKTPESLLINGWKNNSSHAQIPEEIRAKIIELWATGGYESDAALHRDLQNHGITISKTKVRTILNEARKNNPALPPKRGRGGSAGRTSRASKTSSKNNELPQEKKEAVKNWLIDVEEALVLLDGKTEKLRRSIEGLHDNLLNNRPRNEIATCINTIKTEGNEMRSRESGTTRLIFIINKFIL